MQSLSEKVRERLLSFRDPSTGLNLIDSQAFLTIKELEEGIIQIEFMPDSPYNPMVMSYALAMKALASKVEGVKKVIVICRNHVMADKINEELNR